jgi:hypothetical protein
MLTRGEIVASTGRFHIHLAAALCVLCAAIWLSSGTLAPYALLAPQVLDSGYLGNADHETQRAVFLMLDGAPRSAYEFSTVQRRILFFVVAYPFMKTWGFEWGGFLASLILHGACFIVFILFLKSRFGERGAIMGMWLLATYPGITYWAALPYSYVCIVPLSLLAGILIWEMERAQHPRRLFALSVALGILFLGYDLMPIFGLAALVVIWLQKRYWMLPVSLVGFVSPFVILTVVLKSLYGVELLNGNTMFYVRAVNSFLSQPDLWAWAKLLARFPDIFIQTYFFSNFLFLPLFFALVVLSARFGERLELNLTEKGILLAAVAIFTFINLAPPYPGYSLRGTWIPRIYQPVFVAMVLYAARKSCRIESLSGIVKRRFLLLATITIVGNSVVVFGPIIDSAFSSELSSELYYRFFKSVPNEFINHLDRFGRRPLGF